MFTDAICGEADQLVADLYRAAIISHRLAPGAKLP